MVDAAALKQLRSSLQSHVLLYVEDNVGLNQQAVILFQKIFEKVYSAYDGEEGLKLFKLHKPSVVITDITMPKMDGLSMAEAILKIEPDCKIIITTAHDERELLHRSIQIGIFDFLVKPLKIENVTETLNRCAEELKEELSRKIFYTNLHSIFNYQNSLVVLLQEKRALMANVPCLEFFGCSNIGELRRRFDTFGALLLKHNSFLYDHDGIESFTRIQQNPTKLFNVKMADTEGENHHFILRYQSIPEKEGYGVLSLNDVSELGLLKLYDASAVEQERLAKDEKVVRGVMELAVRNGAKVKIHNLYKGLSITNDALIVSINDDVVVIKTPYVQLKAIEMEEKFYLTSELFPMNMVCEGVLKIDFDEQSLKFNHYKLVATSPTRRASIRVVPDDKFTLTLLYEGHKFDADVSVVDVSINAIRFSLPSLPAGFAPKQSLILDMVVMTGGRPSIINTSSEVFRIQEIQRRFEVVATYELHGQAQKNLIDYIAKRQMVLIREFKGLQYEK